MIERYGVHIFKAGVTFLKAVMSDPQNVADVQFYDMSSLRVCTFCAEPVSPAVQQFGMDLMSPQYINSYWATEHGGIVWTHFYGNDDFPLRPDAHTYRCRGSSVRFGLRQKVAATAVSPATRSPPLRRRARSW